MRELVFVQVPGIGPGLVPPRSGSVADLVMAIPYLVHDQIPPRRVLNDVLSRGKDDAGMSCGVIWEPFEIDEGEYRALVDELQRRGRRPVHGPEGVEPGGQPFDVPDLPDRVQTYGEWHVYRYETPEPQRQSILESTYEPPDGRYDRWHSALPVGDLYLSFLSADDPDWESKSDETFGLPTDFVKLLRDLKRVHMSWYGHRRDDIPRMMEERERVDQAINEYIDSHQMPRWPYGPARRNS
jgi:hypothetical protein